MAIVALQCKLLAARSSEQQKARELADATTELQRLERARSVRERSKASALTLVMNCETGNGLEQWRRLCAREDAATATRRCNKAARACCRCCCCFHHFS